MSVTIVGIRFERHHYDPRGDVLYLGVAGYEGPPADALSTSEGHNIEFDDAGRPVAMTLTNVRWLLDRDGDLAITLPTEVMTAQQLAAIAGATAHVSADQLAPALRSVA